MQTKAVILLSGGLDSATCLAIAHSRDLACYALSFDYGQLSAIEVNAARNIARDFGVIDHLVISLETSWMRGSTALTDTNVKMPDSSIFTTEEKENTKEIPLSYVPARNTLFLSYALAWAEVLGAEHIIYGANAIDYSHYPDCRPDYVAGFEKLANLATRQSEMGKPFKVEAPLIHMSKAEIIKTGTALGVNYAQTISCYQVNAKGQACGHCPSCYLRKKGFAEANIPDPTPYQGS